MHSRLGSRKTWLWALLSALAAQGVTPDALDLASLLLPRMVLSFVGGPGHTEAPAGRLAAVERA